MRARVALLLHPVPEADALPHKEIEAKILQALEDAKKMHITGKKVTHSS